MQAFVTTKMPPRPKRNRSRSGFGFCGDRHRRPSVSLSRLLHVRHFDLNILTCRMEMAQDQRQVAFGQARPRVDNRSQGKRLYPCRNAVACRTKLGIRGIVKLVHARNLCIAYAPARSSDIAPNLLRSNLLYEPLQQTRDAPPTQRSELDVRPATIALVSGTLDQIGVLQHREIA